MIVFSKHVKLYAWEMITKGDILVKEIKVKKSIFIFPDPSFDCLFTDVYINNIFPSSLFLWLYSDTR